jgi:lipopolysaccharide export system permease protein
MSVFSRLDRYIGGRVLNAMVVILAILLALFTFLELIDELANYGRGRFGLYALLRFVTLNLPGRIYELFPSAVLLGSVLGLSWLALGSELTAMRAAGVSLLRIVGSAMKTGLIFVVISIVVGETLVPVSDAAAQRGRAEALQMGLQREVTGLWLRDHTSFVNIGEVLPDLTLLNVNIYGFDASERLRTQTFAKRARFEDPRWRLEEVSESRIEPTGIRTQRSATTVWESGITPDVVQIFAVRPESLSTVNLYQYIRHLRRNRQETARYELAFWHKVWLPAATAVMVLLAVPAVFGQFRSGGMGSRVFLAVLLGLAFSMLSRGFGYLALLYGLPPVVAAFAPILMFLLLALYLLRRVA